MPFTRENNHTFCVYNTVGLLLLSAIQCAIIPREPEGGHEISTAG